MISRPLLLLLALSCVSLSCRNEDEAFLPIAELCPQRTQAICSARARHCDNAEDTAACNRDELARCKALSATFEAEEQLSYYTVSAARVREEEQLLLDEGEGPLPLARYFERTLPNDSECERDSQCATGFCSTETDTCESAPELGLCEPE